MPRYSLLHDLSNTRSCAERRDLLRLATDVLTIGPAPSEQEVRELDQVIGLVVGEFSIQVRSDLAKLIAARAADFRSAAGVLATDEIVVAGAILRTKLSLGEEMLLGVVNGCSKGHLMLVSKRPDVTAKVSHALVEKGDNDVVASLLGNECAVIAASTYEVIAARAGDEIHPWKAELIRKRGVPPRILSRLYLTVESELREEIIATFDEMEECDLLACDGVCRLAGPKFGALPANFESAQRRVRGLADNGRLTPPILMALVREGEPSRTAFKLAFSELAEVPYEIIEQITERQDLDALAMLCRGAGFEKALFTGLAIALGPSGEVLSRAIQYSILFESVPAHGAERAVSFWKPHISAFES